MPLDCKLRDGQIKWPFRQVLYRHVPRELIDPSKMGFGVTLHDCLRGSLRNCAKELLNKELLQHEGYSHLEPIIKKWEEHLSSRRNWMERLC